MKIIAADQSRMIDLPGVGPCPRPTDIDETVTGFSRLRSLRIYRFAPGATIEGESEADEVFVVPLDGTIRIEITGTHALAATIGPSGPRALYMTPDHAYRMTPEVETHVAYARAAATGTVPVQVLAGDRSGDLAEALRFRLIDLPDGESAELGGENETLAHVVSGEVRAGDARIAATATLALSPGEQAAVTAEGPVTLLVVTA